MVLEVFLVVGQRRILGELLRNRSVPAEKLSEAAHISAIPVAQASLPIVEILALVVTSFLPHESVRIFLKLLANCGVSLQVLLQCRVLLNKLLVVDQRGISAKLFRNFRMAV